MAPRSCPTSKQGDQAFISALFSHWLGAAPMGHALTSQTLLDKVDGFCRGDSPEKGATLNH